MGSKNSKGKKATKSNDNKREARPVATSNKEPRTRKPPVIRAARLVQQIDKKHTALLKATSKWRGESTSEQAEACATIKEALGNLCGPLSALSEAIDVLLNTKWSPKAGAPGRKPLQPGQRVTIKEKRFDAAVFGEVNSFEVVSTTDQFVLIRAIGTKGAGTPVLRAWIAEDQSDEDAIITPSGNDEDAETDAEAND